MYNLKIWYGGLHSCGFNCDEFNSGGLHEEHAVETWRLGTVSAFFEVRSNGENLCRCGRSQKLPQSNRLPPVVRQTKDCVLWSPFIFQGYFNQNALYCSLQRRRLSYERVIFLEMASLVKTTWKREGTMYTYLLTYLLTYSTEQSPSWEANWFAANQEIPRILWNPKVHYRTHKRPPPVPLLSQLHPVPTTPSHFLKIHLNIIIPSSLWKYTFFNSLKSDLNYKVFKSLV